MPFKRNVLSLFISTSLLFAGASNASSFDDDVDLMTEKLPVVLSATRLEQSILDTPASITVLTHDDIKNSGIRTIPDLFRLVPGFQVGLYGGTQPTITYHGFGDAYQRRLQLLIDGRPSYIPLFGGVPWSDLPLSLHEIKRIEIIRGPNAASYGPNSFSAVISITTMHASEIQSPIISTEIGESDKGKLTLMGGTSGEKYNLRMTAQYERNDHFKGYPDDSQKRFITARSDIDLDHTNSLQVQAGLSRSQKDTGNGSAADEYHSIDTDNDYLQLRWEHNRSSDDSFSIQYYYNRHHVYDDTLYTLNLGTFFDNPLLAPYTGDVRVNANARSERHDIELQRTIKPHPDLRLVYGGSLRQDKVKAPGLFNTNATINNNVKRFFMNGEWHISQKYMLHAGTMLEHNDITGDDMSPRLALTYRIDPNSSVRMSISHATRTPSLYEANADHFFALSIPDDVAQQLNRDSTLLYYRNRAAHNLRSEKILAYELGYHLNNKRQGLDFDIKLFREEISDDINDKEIPYPAATLNNSVDLLANIQDFTVAGLELALDKRFSKNTAVKLNYSYASVWGEQLEGDSVPNDTLTFGITQKIAYDILLNSNFYYHSDMSWRDTGHASDMKKLDLNLKKTIHRSAHTTTLNFRVENVVKSDTNYRKRNKPESSVYAEILTEFN